MNLEVTYLIITGAGSARRMAGLIEQISDRSPHLITVLSDNARRVVSPRALALAPGHQIVESYFDEAILPRPPDGVFLIAPCTFNSLNKLALGIADSLPLSMAAEGIGRGNPMIVAPALNDPLWAHPRARQAVETLRSWGVTVIDPVPDVRGYLTMAPDDQLLEALAQVWAAARNE